MYQKLGRKLTNDEFDIKIKDSQFIRISDYINSKSIILFKCKKCGKVFRKKPKDFNKLRCKCLEYENDYKNSISDKNITLIDDYVNIRTKIRHKCLRCGLIFITSPKTVKNSAVGCPSCSGKIFSIDKYKSLLPKDIVLESDYYNGSNKNLKHRCLRCDFTWETKPNYIIHMGCGCPRCSFSKGERQISDILDESGIEYIPQYLVEINGVKYRFDFFIPEVNLFIEYDGIQHFESVEYFGGESSLVKVQQSDSIKNEWCRNNNFNLIRISYKDIGIFSEQVINF